MADEEHEDINRKRYFHCVYDDTSFGRFCGKTPLQAAKKAMSSLTGKKSNKWKYSASIDKRFDFELVECTRRSARRTFFYSGTKTRLENPVIVTIGRDPIKKIIEFRNKSIVKRIKMEDMSDDVNIPDEI